MVFPTLFWILAVVAAVLCSIGFYRFVWFMSVGYGLAVAGCGAALLIAGLIGGNFSIPYLLLCVLLISVYTSEFMTETLLPNLW